MSELILFFLLVVVTVLTPGPGVLYTISCGFRYGRRHLLLSPAAISLGVFITNVLTAAGLGVVVASSPRLYLAIQIAGALVLVYLGYRNWTAKVVDLSEAQNVNHSAREDNVVGTFTFGVLLSVTNPVLIVSLVALFPQFIHPDENYLQKAALLITIYTVVCFVGHKLSRNLKVWASRYLKGERVSRILNRGSAVLFWLISLGILGRMLPTS